MEFEGLGFSALGFRLVWGCIIIGPLQSLQVKDFGGLGFKGSHIRDLTGTLTILMRAATGTLWGYRVDGAAAGTGRRVL